MLGVEPLRLPAKFWLENPLRGPSARRYWCWRHQRVSRAAASNAFSPPVFLSSFVNYDRDCRLSARSGLSTNPHTECAFRPMTICWRYFHTSIFTSQRDGLKILCFLITLGPDFFLSKMDSIFSTENIVFRSKDAWHGVWHREHRGALKNGWCGACYPSYACCESNVADSQWPHVLTKADNWRSSLILLLVFQ